MTPERFQRIAEIFRDAGARTGAEREAFLDRVCDGDGDLRARVQRLLDADEDASRREMPSTVERPLAGATEFVRDQATALPDRIGPYRIKRLIAEGGMGRVYLAVQDRPHRTVALKIMKAGIASRSALRRFEYEAQILARLRHPHIAQVFDAGTHDTGAGGVPYFAMEYVPSPRSIIEHARTRKLDLRARLELFAKVCDAVHHGHQKGIIHRDLKPGNILVDSAGEPKVIDFGVARATDSDMTVTTLQTDIGQLLGTLQYMSPEQCDADPHDIDTRSDVYALGVVLYELVCDRLPYDVGRAIHEAVRVIREATPERPSAVHRALRGDVETIVLKTLEKDRTRRYQSAGSLAADIGRFLAGEPIAARRASFTYLLRTYARRHAGRIATTAAFVVLLAALVVVVWLLQQRVPPDEQLRLATQRVIEEVKDSRISEVKARAIASPFVRAGIPVHSLIKAEEYLNERLAGQPTLAADLRTTIGLGYLELGDHSRAEQHLRLALDQRLLVAMPPDDDVAWGFHNLGKALFGNCRFEEAAAKFGEAAEMRRTLFGDSHPKLADSIDWIAACRRRQGRLDESEALRLDMLAMREDLLAKGEPDMERKVTASWNNLAACWRDQGRYAEAKPVFERVLRASKTQEITDLYVARAMRSVASCCLSLGEYEEAKTLLTDAAERTLREASEQHPDAATNTFLLARYSFERGDLVTAERLCREALRVQDAMLESPHTKIADTTSLLGRVLVETGEACLVREGGRYLDESRAMREVLLGAEHPELAACYADRARLHLALGELEEAETWCRRAKGMLVDRVPAHPATGETMHLLGRILVERGRTGAAEPLFENAVSILAAALPADHKDVLAAKTDLERCRSRLGLDAKRSE